MNLKKSIYLLFILFIGSIYLNAQSESSINKEVDKLMGYDFSETYKSALDLLIGLDEKNNGKNPIYRYKIAICYLKTNINKKKGEGKTILQLVEHTEDAVAPSIEKCRGSREFLNEFGKTTEEMFDV